MIKIQNRLDRFQNAVTSGFYYGLRIILSIGLGFLTAKCELFENFSPFALILLSVSANIGIFPTFCYLGSAFGFLTVSFDLSVFKYITALTMIYVVYMVFRKSMHILNGDNAVLSAACCFTAGFLFLLAGQLSLFNVLVLVGESILICCCIYFINYAAKAFRRCCYLSSRELIAAVITLVLVMVMLHNIYIFGMSTARMLAIILLFLALSTLKIGHTAVLGSCLGIILAAVGSGGEAVFTAMIVATLVGCVFLALSERVAMTSFILIYYVILLFFGNFPWNYWYFAEPLVAYAVVFFVPKARLSKFLSQYITVRTPKNAKNVQVTAKDLISSCQQECALICPKAAICYQKNEVELTEALETLSERFQQTEELGSIEDAVPFCIKQNAMKKIIEKKLVERDSENFDELTEQLNRLTHKLEVKMEAALKTVHFFAEEEQSIKNQLESRRISVKDINFILDEYGCKKCDIQFKLNGDILYKKIIREVLEPYFAGGLTLGFKEKEGDYAVHIKESSIFDISCSALCKAKSGEQISGDTALGFSAGRGSYYLILADGMGSGKDAGIQSEMVIDVLRKLITGGLSVSNALNIYRSTTRFKQSSTFATIDICAIELNQGTADFYKAGAYDSFHLHGNSVSVLHGGGLPLGLGECDRLHHQHVKVDDGDYLILASDGLSVINEPLEQVLLNCKNDDARLFAQNILRRLAEENNAANDDVTVMVCKFHKKAV